MCYDPYVSTLLASPLLLRPCCVSIQATMSFSVVAGVLLLLTCLLILVLPLNWCPFCCWRPYSDWRLPISAFMQFYYSAVDIGGKFAAIVFATGGNLPPV
jgi:hypothetical protein